MVSPTASQVEGGGFEPGPGTHEFFVICTKFD